MRLLAVDDHPDSATLVARIAERSGFDAIAISDPHGVADLLRRIRPAVLTMDLCMPELDAIDLFRVLETAGFDGTVILISGQHDNLRQAAVKLAGVHGVKVVGNLQKPVDVARLRALLDSLRAAEA